jgi:leader peptidase (prepilin peptidase)/N-methyltransferase
MKTRRRSGRRVQIARFAFVLLSIVAAASSIIVAPWLRGILGAALALLMCAIALYDARYFRIPDGLNAAALALALLHAAVAEPDVAMWAIGMAILRGMVSAAMFFAIELAYERLRERQGMGMGDIKLAGVAGTWLDWIGIVIAIEIAAVAALGSYLLYRMISRRPLRASSMLPFGLYFAPAIWVAWLIEMLLFTL